MITIQLPFPPSVNAIWRNVHGKTLKSKRYRVWANAAGWELKSQGGKVPGKVQISIALERKDNRRRDLDNHAKAILDLLCEHQVIDDDSLVQKLTLEWSNVKGAVVQVAEV